MKLLLAGICLATLQATLVGGYGSGAPPEACVDMIPQHGPKPQPLDTTPYKINVDKKAIKSGEQVRVTIDGAPFKGFFIQAHVGDKPTGHFEATSMVKLVDCSGSKGSGATHPNADEKPRIVASWTSPKGLEETVKFRVTVAKNGGEYWVGHYSDPVTVTKA